MSTSIYRIRNWDKHYENNRTREMVKMSWVPVPNKHDGEGFQRIMREKDGLVIYGCWHLILQVASKCLRPRGTLLRDDGTPLDAASIALKTGVRDEKLIQRALDFCCLPQVAWIEQLASGAPDSPQEGAGLPQEGALNRIEENGKEKKDLRAYGERGKVMLCDSDVTKLKEIYGCRFDKAIDMLDSYMASSGKKYKDCYAVMKRNGWVYEKAMAGVATSGGKLKQEQRMNMTAAEIAEYNKKNGIDELEVR